MNGIADIINAGAALAWPFIVLVLLLVYRSTLAAFITRVTDVSVKAAGVEATAKIAAAVAGAAAQRPDSADPKEVLSEATNATNLALNIYQSSIGNRERTPILLWVDDQPGNNRYERTAFEALGIRIDLATSTDQALALARSCHYDAVLSDMSRPPDHQAGYTLLDNLRGAGVNTPYIIYAGTATPADVAEARQRGAYGRTNQPSELIELTVRALAGL